MSSSASTELVNQHSVRLYELTPDTTYHYRVISSTDTNGPYYYSGDYTFVTRFTKSGDEIVDKSTAVNCPNPCKTRTDFCYYLNDTVDKTTISIYTLSGRKVTEFESSYLNKGWNKYNWDLKDDSGNELSNGLYIYQIKIRKGNIEEKVKKANLMIVK